MAGMLPGVESARRRRVHKCGGFSDSPSFSSHNTSRRSSFCLYASNHESRISSSSSMVCSIHLSQQLNYLIYSFPFFFFIFLSLLFINFIYGFVFKTAKKYIIPVTPR